MGLMSASASLVRYRILEEIPKDLWARIPDLLQEFSFQEIEQTRDEQGFGWVCFEDMLDNTWQTAPPSKGEFLLFSLRLDTRRIPPAVMKKYYQLAQEEALAQAKERGQPYLSRTAKQELREQVRLRLLGQILPVPAVFDVVWNTASQVIYFFSGQQKVRSLFEDLFAQTFKLHLEPLTAYFLARHAQKGVDDYQPVSVLL